MTARDVCSACGFAIRTDTRFCIRCGASLVVALVAEPEPVPDQPPGETGPDPYFEYIAPAEPLRYIAWLFGGFLLVSLPVAIVARVDGPSVALEVVASLLQATLVGVCLFQRSGHLEQFFFPRVALRKVVGASALASAAVLVWMSGYFFILESLGAPLLSATKTFVDGHASFVLTLVICCALPAVVEEIGFRALLQTELESIMPENHALFVQAAAFSILHFALLSFVSHLGFGLILGILRTRTRSILPGMAIHGGWNLLVVLDELRIVTFLP